ncbi:hypothetical protein HZH68_002821 [Vespula germanica]|uniref:Uncharacterized protein n=3 Tax=Vespula TaxID=7451 RepID=A0A834NN06_VESGE|nr:hypothetical protein HZH66_002363 [Vespula vulgaris]KAF7414332.1 hypothetical protein HZH68_002821 [Vespula germanica]KAF7434727.1 hypothetical protein H0235_002918 [Vespula pensylvanica]
MVFNVDRFVNSRNNSGTDPRNRSSINEIIELTPGGLEDPIQPDETQTEIVATRAKPRLSMRTGQLNEFMTMQQQHPTNL